MSEFESHEGLPREAEVLRARRESMERLRESGIEPFAMSYYVDTHAADLLEEFEGRLANEEESDRRASVAGRVVLARRHGKLTFLVIRDRTGDLQLFCEEASLGEGYGLLDEIDLGDIVGATGHVVRTRRGELSLKVDSLTMLTKALRPLPEKWHGLQDPDLQQRRRYLHLITDPAARGYVSARATVLRTIRHELDGRGYTEVETPVLQAVAGGALAKPFTTYHNALDTELKLRISLELYLKRMLVGGLERIYEIGRNFRNEGIDREHNPEFTMLELYEAYGDYETMMRIAEDLIRACALAVNGSLTFTFRDRQLDLSAPFRRVTVLGAVSDAVGEDVTLDRADLAELAARHGVAVDPAWGAGKIVLEMFEKLAEATLLRSDVRLRLPARGLSARPAASQRSGAHRALRRHRRRDRARHGLLRADGSDRAAGEVRGADGGAARGRRRGPSARRGLHDGARARHAADRRDRHRDRSAAHGAHGRAVAPGPDPVPAPPARELLVDPGRLPRAEHAIYSGRANARVLTGAGGGDAMDEQGTIERIKSVPLFSGFGDKELQRVAAIAKEVEFPAGKVIAKQGETGVGFHMIADGEATVSVDGVDRATLGSGLVLRRDVADRRRSALRDRDRGDRPEDRLAHVLGLQRPAGSVPGARADAADPAVSAAALRGAVVLAVATAVGRPSGRLLGDLVQDDHDVVEPAALRHEPGRAGLVAPRPPPRDRRRRSG